MIRLFKISGDSLYPLLKSGQRVLCIKVFSFTRLRVDDLVVFNKKSYGLMIKKITIKKGDSYFVEGTDALSIDSRNFGLIQHCEIKYRVLRNFRT